MLTKDFIQSCTEQEQMILYLIIYNTIFRIANYEPGVEYIKFLRPQPTIYQIEKLRKKILPENYYILDSLKNKLQNYK
jgi:hypothetical protein